MSDGLNVFGTQELVEVPADLTSGGDIENTNDATPKAPLGVMYRHKGNVYRYVKFNNGDGDVAAIAGGVVYWLTITPYSALTPTGTFTVTGDYSYAYGGGENVVAGITGCVVTDGYYTWIQVGGVANCYCNSSTVAGDVMIHGGDNVFGRLAAGAGLTAVPAGVALEAYDTGFADCLLIGLMW